MSKRHRSRSPLPCAVCLTRRAQAGLTICAGCETDTRARLRKQADLRRALLVTFDRQDKLDAPPEAGRSANRPLAYHPAAGDAIADQRRLLLRWVGLIVTRDSRPGPACPACTHPSCRALRRSRVPELWAIGTLTGWLLDQWPHIRVHENVPQLVVGLQEVTARIVEVIDHPLMKAVTLGPCPMLDEQGRHCRGQVQAFLPLDGTNRPAWVRCALCKQEWAGNQWTRLGRLIARRAAAVGGAPVVPATV